jgi:hypothetical protein
LNGQDLSQFPPVVAQLLAGLMQSGEIQQWRFSEEQNTRELLFPMYQTSDDDLWFFLPPGSHGWVVWSGREVELLETGLGTAAHQYEDSARTLWLIERVFEAGQTPVGHVRRVTILDQGEHEKRNKEE